MTEQKAPSTPADLEAAAETFRTDYAKVRDEISKVVVGHGEALDGVLTGLFAGGHVLLEGVPGIGKTLLVRTLASVVDMSFGRVQFTPDLMPADITGTTVVREVEEAGRVSREFVFERGPIFAEVILADEINRATPKTQSALLEAMQEGRVTVAGVSHDLPRPFFVLATQNPVEQEGTYPLPEAQLDRFMIKLIVGYSDRVGLSEVVQRTTGGSSPSAKQVMTREQLLAHQALVREVEVTDHVRDYAVRCVLATHPRGEHSDGAFATEMVNSYVRLGASPRAAQALVLGGKVRALLDGRGAVSMDDIRWMGTGALRHRLVMNFEAEAGGVTADSVVTNLLETVPREGPSA